LLTRFQEIIGDGSQIGTTYTGFHLILKHRSWIELKLQFNFIKKEMDIQMLVLGAALLMLVNFIAM
jgi:hypothetical protein